MLTIEYDKDEYDAENIYSENEYSMKRILSATGDHATTVSSNDAYNAQCDDEPVQDGWKSGLEGWKASNMIISRGTGDHTTSVGSKLLMPTQDVEIVDSEVISAGESVLKAQNKIKEKEYNLVGLVGWWRRNEREEEKFWKESKKKLEEKNIRTMSRMSFVRNMSGKPHEMESQVEVKTPVKVDFDPNLLSGMHATNSNSKRKLFLAEDLAGTPSKVRKISASFTSTWRFGEGKEGCEEQQHIHIDASFLKTEEWAVLSTSEVVQESLVLSNELHHN